MAAAASTYLAWWEQAGVDCAIGDAPVNWLRPAAAASAPVPDIAPASRAKPATLAEFRAWLMADDAQPERRWPGAPILPQGQEGASLMIVTDMPDPADMHAGSLLSDRAGQLFGSMLRAIGLVRQEVYITSLFLSRPPGGMVEAGDLSQAAERMRTHVALAAPDRLLLLGDRTIRTLFSVQDKGGMDHLQFFNHDGGTVRAYATFHPRLLLGQPAAKAECWRILQGLIEEQDS